MGKKDKKVKVSGTEQEHVLSEDQLEALRKQIVVEPCYVPGNFPWNTWF